MKRYSCFQIIILIVLFLSCKEKQNETPSFIPANDNNNIVYDLSNLFSQSERDSIAQKIIRFEKQTTNQAVILTVDSIPKNMNIQYFGTEVANSWRVGTKEKDNGLLIIISKFDRKVAISTGLGTEKTISDYECKVIIDSLMTPQFKNKDYYNGVNKALDSLFILWD